MSKVTAKYQITIPLEVRKKLGIGACLKTTIPSGCHSPT
jgi:bifunctional DNA-binding transcriptional regulator/antitoxin component of YhaV-PrlF toxin-antitoxin module